MKFFMSVAVVIVALAVPARAGGLLTAAPDVALTSETGSTVRLSELKGRVVLLDFWASWCVPCRASFPAIDALQKELHGLGLTALAINVDGFGDRPNKISKYEMFTRERVRFNDGFKLFYEEDTNLMSPASVLALRPPPDVVVYE